MTARAAGYESMQTPDMEARIARMFRYGKVVALSYGDPAGPRVRVKSGDLTTGWIPWTVGRAGGDSEWSPLDIGEQVVLGAPSGDLSQAVILGSIHQSAHPAPDTSGNKTVTVRKDGMRTEYDRESHTYTMTVPEGGKIVYQCGASSLEITSARTTLKTPEFAVDAPESSFTGNVVVRGLLSFLGGLFGRNDKGGGTATIHGPVTHLDGPFSSNGIVIHTHQHKDAGGSGNSGGPI